MTTCRRNVNCKNTTREVTPRLAAALPPGSIDIALNERYSFSPVPLLSAPTYIRRTSVPEPPSRNRGDLAALRAPRTGSSRSTPKT